jgi:hypothetical protein
MPSVAVKLMAVYFLVLAVGSLMLPLVPGMTGASFAIAPAVSATVYVATALGLWLLWGWARVAALVINGVSAAALLVGLFRSDVTFSERATHFGFSVALVSTCLYLLRPETRDHFRAARR